MTTAFYEIGDKVAVLDDAIEGVVTKVEHNKVTINTSDGFLMTYFFNEVVKINKTNDLNNAIYNSNLINKDTETKLTQRQKVILKKLEVTEKGIPEFDLHIEKLVKSKNGLSNFDILNIQIDTAQRHIEFAIKNRIPKIVLIHGVGEGVLKTELEFLLKKYHQISFEEASYQKYGLGATMIYFKQNLK